jgi:hypothetical protein
VEHDGRGPDLPVQECVSDESSLELVATAVIVEQESSLEHSSLIVLQELGRVGVVMKHPEGGDGDNNGEDTYESVRQAVCQWRQS